jgi:hypothetical protein
MKIKTIVDHVGHNVLGELVEETDSKIVLKNPAILIAQPNQNNQLQVQLFPIIFKEFLGGKSKEDGAKFIYNKDKVVDTEIELDEKLEQQYKLMFSGAAPGSTTQGSSDSEVIKLFDE